MNLEELNRAVLIIGDSLQQVAAAAKNMASALAENVARSGVADYGTAMVALEAVLQAAAGMTAQDFLPAMEELAELAVDMPPLPRPKTPRPPKCLGPVNKTNHIASRPPRRARSSCYKRHR